jgi:hypothetical protein
MDGPATAPLHEHRGTDDVLSKTPLLWRGGCARLRDEENKIALSRLLLSRRSHQLCDALIFPVSA